MGDLEDMMDDVFEMFDDISDLVVFTQGLVQIKGHVGGRTSKMEAPSGMGQGPKKLRTRCKLAVSRVNLPTDPLKVQSIVADPDGLPFRIAAIDPDGAGLLLTLETLE